MCGIVGYAGNGKRRAAEFVYRGLERLEYRGYDSAGLAVFSGGEIRSFKRAGRVSAIGSTACEMQGNVGIGHTRWATHGKPTDINAHPHTVGKITLVHNGIIENYAELKRIAEESGYSFLSETDSEAAAWLIDCEYARADGEKEKKLLNAVRRATEKLKGSFAFCVLCSDFPEGIVAAKRGSPLILGEGEKENFAASDIPALAGETERFHVLKDGAFAFFTAERMEIYDSELRPERAAGKRVCIRAESPDKNGYPHFMLKEIFEQPTAIERTAERYLFGEERGRLKDLIKDVKRLVFIACGTAYHSALAARYAIEELARLPVCVERAGEFRSQNPVLDSGTLVIAVTQSGETADTVAALKLAKERGAKTVALTNAAYSSVTTVAELSLVTSAGTEIGVAATKSYLAQLCALFLFTLDLAEERFPFHAVQFELYRRFIQAMPLTLGEILKRAEEIKPLAKRLACAAGVYYLGKLSDYATATEGSLKLKEIAYIAGESYPSGELKHGTLALIDDTTFSVAVVSSPVTAEKTFNALHEIKARGGKTLLVTPFSFAQARDAFDEVFLLPEAEDLTKAFGLSGETASLFLPILCIPPLQLLAYYAALERGNDPDKPRNLAKSVTVE
ncbi:MAG: glutamine--fructose-6-phosphate transaminase (isomerizing) [Clostridia bacterium]|nr:glutamine--fructose-6-phosphate transaminase (isomerizing) [Clostridia bacterium]